MPCHEFNELEYFSYNPVLGYYKYFKLNYWGYSTINYFSPKLRYASVGGRNGGLDAINEFKQLIKEAHKRGIEGVDNSVFYMLAPKILEDDLLTTGSSLTNPPLIDMISNDLILRGVKLIAEAWDCGGLYQVVRQFIKGTDGFSGVFAEWLCGSPNLYQEGGRKPWNSIYFICAHDGFTLADLVMHSDKHYLANGVDNKDVESHNNSWNCGQS
ncbi:unnamed protein product [Lactuca saligna]|uniref:Uncharacterized protein n=1 Tax=Lactuca saligna TaxID=75948 RepID=A0AA36E8T5_LACSI|nr:unnamed protein product [Lactuca saligna]